MFVNYSLSSFTCLYTQEKNVEYSPSILFLPTPFVCKTDVLKSVSLINYLHLASSKSLQFSTGVVFYPHSTLSLCCVEIDWELRIFVISRSGLFSLKEVYFLAGLSLKGSNLSWRVVNLRHKNVFVLTCLLIFLNRVIKFLQCSSINQTYSTEHANAQ